MLVTRLPGAFALRLHRVGGGWPRRGDGMRGPDWAMSPVIDRIRFMMIRVGFLVLVHLY